MSRIWRNSGSKQIDHPNIPRLFTTYVLHKKEHGYEANIGWPGKLHEAQILVNSSLYTKAISHTLLHDWKRQLFGVDVPLLILGDPAYPLLPWLMKPYLENERIQPEERQFNYRQSCARKCIGKLKGRWRCSTWTSIFPPMTMCSPSLLLWDVWWSLASRMGLHRSSASCAMSKGRGEMESTNIGERTF